MVPLIWTPGSLLPLLTLMLEPARFVGAELDLALTVALALALDSARAPQSQLHSATIRTKLNNGVFKVCL